jgi:hypothetical protein
MEVLFIGIPEIKIEVRHGGQSSLPQRHDILDDCRASGQRSKFLVDEPVKRKHTKGMLFPEPATIVRNDQYMRDYEGTEGVRLPWIHNKDVVDLDFHSTNILPWKNHVAVPSC